MSFILFVDESGSDNRASPYEVLAGVAVVDSGVWSLITALQAAEVELFGQRITRDELELKGKKLLKKKTFRLADQLPPFAPGERTTLAHECLREGEAARAEGRRSRETRRQLTALGQAKIAFVGRALDIAIASGVRAFASIVDCDAPRPAGSFLRKDYSYLFQRFFHFLEEQPGHHQGLVVFDELERSRSHMLVGQMGSYFKDTAPGRERAARIIPEPFFVHSDLTSLIQLADLVAYTINWGVRVGGMNRDARPELASLGEKVKTLRGSRRDGPYTEWDFAVIDDLRPREERTK